VRRLGHEPVLFRGDGRDHLDVDAAVIEPGEPDGLRLARSLAISDVPVLFTSIYPADAELLALSPAAYLVKPFPLYALERALDSALATMATPAAAAV